MKRFVLLAVILFAVTFAGWGVDLSMSYSPWTFITRDERISPGLYPCAGLTVGWNDWLESELFLIAEAAPEPLGSLYVGGSLGSSVLGSRGLTYFNAFAQLDFLYGFDFSGDDITYNRLLGIRLSPLTIGNGYNGFRDRIFTVGAFYNFDSSSFSFSWNVLIFDVFLLWS